jgi:hypothetical protein
MRIQHGLMRYWSNFREQTNGFNKSDLLSAVTATDIWIDTNQTSYNNTLPATFKTNATLAQKTLLFCAVALARVSIILLRQIFGEVD